MLTRLDRQGRIEERSFRERVAIRLAQASRRGLTHFTRDCRAIAAVEFALILPLLVLLYVGAGELSQGVMTSRRVTLLSRTLADLTSQQPTFTQATSTPMPANAMLPATLSSMLDAGTAIMAPGSLTPLTMTISAVDIVNNAAGLCCVFRVRWSYTQGGQLRPCGTNLVPADPHNLPSALHHLFGPDAARRNSVFIDGSVDRRRLLFLHAAVLLPMADLPW